MEIEPKVYVIDDDEGIRDALGLLLETVGQAYELYESATEFLEAYSSSMSGCLVLDIRMPRMTGMDLQKQLVELKSALPIIFITGHGDIPMAVKAMQLGALDFIRKPFREQDLLDRINEALKYDADNRQEASVLDEMQAKISSLTNRESEVFDYVARGEMNKVIAIDLGISERTVEVHRAQVMKKLEVRTLAQLVRIKIEQEQRQLVSG